MAYQIPTTQELVDQNISFFESRLNQTVPDVDKAFVRTWAVALAVMQTSLFKLSISEGLQSLALTATGEGLDKVGKEYGVIRKPAEAAVLRGTIPTTGAVTLPQSYSFTGDNNAVRYFPNSSYASVANVITADVTAQEIGISGNLNVDDLMTMASPLAGASSILTVTEVLNVGAAEEDDDAYRVRVLSAIRTLKGGGNPADYRRWSESVAGVAVAYPYSKRPHDEPGYPGTPPDRTVYVEVTTDIDPDGIAPLGILDEVRAAIITNDVTGEANQPLGITDDELYVQSIFRTELFVRINNLVVDAAVEVSVKADIEAGITAYLYGIRQFIVGVDFTDDKNDTVTILSLSDIVNDIIVPAGATVDSVEFGLSAGSYTLSKKTTGEGEGFKVGAVDGIVYA